VSYLEAEAPQGPYQDVVGYIGPEIPDVGVVIDRGAASIKTHPAGLERLKDL
jgi:hypothetical protein